MLSDRKSVGSRITPAAAEMSRNVCNCAWIGAIVASFYFVYAAVNGNSSWSSVFFSLAVAFVAKCLAVAMADHKNRVTPADRDLVTDHAREISSLNSKQSSEDLAPDIRLNGQAAPMPNCGKPDPITSNVDKQGWNDGAYQVGYTLGAHWARRDSNAEQTQQLKNIGDGMNWVKSHHEDASGSAINFDMQETEMTDTTTDAMKDPSPSFLAGFIDGAQKPET